MCGLAGILGTSDSGRKQTLTVMGEALRHRGPDDMGIWCPPGQLGLVHRRLSIIDLSERGAQPMMSSNERWVIAFNGEIYNYRAIRRELEAEGKVYWHGKSDTEILVEAIAKWGLIDALNRCNGMFSLAVWDRKDQLLSLARDRSGEKPLYVGWLGGDVVFASELKALHHHKAWQGSVEPTSLSLMLSLGFVPAPLTIHPNVFKLPAASIITLSTEHTRTIPSAQTFTSMTHRYWKLEEVIESSIANPWRGNQDSALEEIQRCFDQSVELRMTSDVPIGALLSGGIDSTLLVASMARQSSSAVRTFTVGFSEPDADETGHAEAVAAYWGTEHETLQLPPNAALNLVERLPEIYDEPFADAAQLPAILVAEAARRNVKVALTGDGGDEFFHGYQRYLDAHRNWKHLLPYPLKLRQASAACLLSLAALAGPGDFSQRLRRQAPRIAATDADDYYFRLLSFPGTHAISPSPKFTNFDWPQPPGCLKNLSERMRFVDQTLSLPDGILTKLDRSSMAAGLELRAPFLDHQLLALAWQMPPQWHRDNTKGKKLLRRLLNGQAPPDIISRRKKGFDVPISAWLRGPLREWSQDLLSASSISADPLLNVSTVQRCLDEHLSNRSDHGFALWALLMYRTWCLRYD
jgi:asparagine synthase (glutamine-hydrolysing)